MESVDYTDYTAEKRVINFETQQRSFRLVKLEDVSAMIPPKAVAHPAAG